LKFILEMYLVINNTNTFQKYFIQHWRLLALYKNVMLLSVPSPFYIALQVTVELVSEPVPFPSVTLCNMRSLDFTVLNRINNLFKEDKTALSYVNKSLGDPFIESYMSLVARFSALYYFAMNADSPINYEMVRALQEGITRSALYSYVHEDVLSKAGIGPPTLRTAV